MRGIKGSLGRGGQDAGDAAHAFSQCLCVPGIERLLCEGLSIAGSSLRRSTTTAGWRSQENLLGSNLLHENSQN